MAKKKIVAVFLSVLMFVYFNNNLPFDLRPCSCHNHSQNLSSRLQRAGQLNSLDLSFGKHTAKREHVRVRYMGSHVGFQSAPVFVAFRTTLFAAQHIQARSSTFVSSGAHFLFKLRGPPVATA